MRIDFPNDAPTRRRADAPNVNAENKSEIFLKKACNYAEKFVPLHHIQDVMRVWASAQHSKRKILTLHSPCTTLVIVER